MSEDITRHLLFEFYGINTNSKYIKCISKSQDIENFDNVANVDFSRKQSLSEEIERIHIHTNLDLGKNDNVKKKENVSKSTRIFTINEVFEENKEEHFKNKSNSLATNFTKLDNSCREMNNISAVPITVSVNEIIDNKNLHLSSTSTKQLWNQKRRHSKRNLLASQNLLAKFNGIYLDLNSAGLRTFSVDILHELSELQILYLDSNNLITIPTEFFIKLKNLKWLDIRNNKLISIPLSIKGHKSLETLLLQGNNIEKLPLELGLIPNLKNLQIAHNPIIFPPQDILNLDCLQIINFLRNEWNKENSNEKIKLKKIKDGKIEKTLSTIICYQPTLKTSFRSNIYNNFKNTEKISIRSRSWTYKPSSRCQSSTGNIQLQQKKLWIIYAKELLCNQEAELQRSIDSNVLDKWRCNYKLNKRHNNILKYSLDPPFAVQVKSSEKNINKKIKSSKSQSDCITFRNFIESFNKFEESFKKIDLNVSGNRTPYSEQKQLETEIEKITELQRKLQYLKFYNVSAIAPYKGSENLSKKYISSPSIR